MTLREQMDELVRRAREVIRHAPADGDVHRQICCELADEFDLWTPDGEGFTAIPAWLSRVVEGEMRGIEEAESRSV